MPTKPVCFPFWLLSNYLNCRKIKMKKDCFMKFSYLLLCSLAHPSKTVSEKSIEHTSTQVHNRNSASASCLILWTTLAHRCLESDYPVKRCLQYFNVFFPFYAYIANKLGFIIHHLLLPNFGLPYEQCGGLHRPTCIVWVEFDCLPTLCLY